MDSQIVMIPSPGAGHLIPLIELARRLIHHDPSLSFTLILIGSSGASSLSSLPAAVDVIILPDPSFPTLSSVKEETVARILRCVHYSLPTLRQTLLDMTRKRHVASLIADIFSTEVIELGSELGIKSYIFCSGSAVSLSFNLLLPQLVDDHHWARDKPVRIPGFDPTLIIEDLPTPIVDKKTISYTWFLEHARRYTSAEGIILNSFYALESGPIRALLNPSSPRNHPPVYPVGPLVRPTTVDLNHHSSSGYCLRWLDEQPPKSVLYVNFGSGGTLSTEQVTELAWGLELSEQRFLWVVRSPNDLMAFGTFLSLEEESDPLGFLPKGFLDRTKGRGLAVKSWAPQAQILNHGSTGGFMTHCGWNSILEGVTNGVRFIAWPMFGEQRMNAVELKDQMKVVLTVLNDSESIVGRNEIAQAVKMLMEDDGEAEEIEARMKVYKDEAQKAIDKDGSSIVALSELALMLKA